MTPSAALHHRKHPETAAVGYNPAQDNQHVIPYPPARCIAPDLPQEGSTMPTATPSEPVTPRLSRRHLLAGTGGTAASAMVGPAHARDASPVATTIDPAAFRALCQAITGSESLDDAGLEQLLDLFLEDDEMTTGLHELLKLDIGPNFDLLQLDFPLLVVTTNILQFWYLGSFRNQPLKNRDQRAGRLLSYQALPYFTAPAVCKTFGYWATDPNLPNRS